MKSVVVVYQGAADLPSDELDDKTPLQIARCDFAHKLAADGQGGLLEIKQKDCVFTGEAMLALLCGVSPEKIDLPARGPLEALEREMYFSEFTHVCRGNFITLDDMKMTGSLVSNLSFEETRTLADALNEWVDPSVFRVETLDRGKVLIFYGERLEAETWPTNPDPYHFEREDVRRVLFGKSRRGMKDNLLQDINGILAGHPINDVRVDLGENPANGLWMWGGGPLLNPGALGDQALVGRGGLLSQSTVARGFGRWAGLDVIRFEDPWDDDIDHVLFKVAELVEFLRESDFLAVYVEAPNERGIYGSVVEKIRCLERLDHHLLGPLITLLQAHRPFRLTLLSDGVVSTERCHLIDQPVPIVQGGEDIKPDSTRQWDEEACAGGSLGLVNPSEIATLIRNH